MVAASAVEIVRVAGAGALDKNSIRAAADHR
jgi:hypothetical protein